MKDKKLLHSISDISLVTLPYHKDSRGDLLVIEGETHVPFMIARVFIVTAENGSTRGQHAHIQCSQFLTCPQGEVEVTCNDGYKQQEYIINRPNIGLLIPPGIWAQEKYLKENSTLTVFCDRPYEEDDYIHDFDEFRKYTRHDV